VGEVVVHGTLVSQIRRAARGWRIIGAMDEWWDDEYARQAPVAVPHTELSPEALRGVVESFVLREGTDYGERDVPFEAKVAQVIRQLERGEARIMFDPVAQSVQIVTTARE
jgi:uncharacterized protein YheU (UPF0270 family)